MKLRLNLDWGFSLTVVRILKYVIGDCFKRLEQVFSRVNYLSLDKSFKLN